MAMAASTANNNPAKPWPLFDLFLDLPHPAASKSCPPPVILQPPPASTQVTAGTLQDEHLANLVSQIARFCFPEFQDDTPDLQRQAAQLKALPLNRYDRYCLQTPGFQHFTFTLQLQSGVRLHGHVRRYCPLQSIENSNAQVTRYDVGRRGQRALVLLTRTSGGADRLYAAILKSVEAITSQQAALEPALQPRKDPQQWFLSSLAKYHEHLIQVYNDRPPQQRDGKPLIAGLEGLEVGTHPTMPVGLKKVDVNRFIIPTCLLYRKAQADPSATEGTNSLLPLLRCVGIAHALRILSALLSERRIVLVSDSPTRLATCSHAALAMISQGLLHWQHLYIPVLPCHLFQYLAAPYPYLIGILASMVPKLDRTDGLGECLIVNLDTNSMETRGMDTNTISQRIPDLFYNPSMMSGGPGTGPIAVVDPIALMQQQGAAGSPTEFLAQDLGDILKTDKRILYGESALDKMGETAAKATKAVKNTFLKMKNKGKQYLQQRSGSMNESSTGAGEGPSDEGGAGESKSLAADYIYTEGCHNEICEEEARVAFATFFLCLFGDMRWYLSTPKSGQVPVLDRNRFLQQKRSTGDGEGTAIWPLLQNFCQTQMLEEFAKARIEEVRTREPITADAPLFARCAHYHRQHNIDFGLISVRRISRQLSESSPARLTGMLQTNARKNAMTLTSNKTFEGDYGQAVAQLIEQCRESTAVLFDVMSVIWLRIRDSRGMQWKHGYHALQLVRNLILHGPLAAVTEATDGLEKIRAMKYYENMRKPAADQVRSAAMDVYNLLVDRSRLFSVRRFCAARRREIKEPKPRPMRDNRMSLRVPFRNLHALASPNARGTVVRIPPTPPGQSAMDRGQPQQAQRSEPPTDLLGMSSAPAPAPASATEPDLFGLTSAPAVPAPNGSASQDVLGMFNNMSVSSSSQQQQPNAAQNPFASMASPPPTAITPSGTPAGQVNVFAAPGAPPLSQQQHTPVAPGTPHQYPPVTPHVPPPPSQQHAPSPQFVQGLPGAPPPAAAQPAYGQPGHPAPQQYAPHPGQAQPPHQQYHPQQPPQYGHQSAPHSAQAPPPGAPPGTYARLPPAGQQYPPGAQQQQQQPPPPQQQRPSAKSFDPFA